MPQEPVKIVLIMEDGQLQEVLSCGVPVVYAVVDYDTDDADQQDIFSVPQIDGTTALAVGHHAEAIISPSIALSLFESVPDSEQPAESAPLGSPS